jgi:hypothetical protein
MGFLPIKPITLKFSVYETVSSTKIVFAFSLIISLCGRVSAQETFQTLFDGNSLDGWEGSSEYWRVEEGTIVGEITEGERLEQNHCLSCDGIECA